MISRETKLKCLFTGAVFVVIGISATHIEYANGKESGKARIDFINELFESVDYGR